jgi:hypothetical protein
MPHPRGRNARDGQFVVKPRRQAAPKVSANRLMERRQHLKHYEYDTHDRERRRTRVASLHRADQQSHGDRKCCWKQPA